MTFPRFEDVIYASSFLEQWEALRLVCTQKHFDTYFRMTVGDETLPINEIDAFINQCGDKTYVKVAFREALRSVRKNGRSKVPLLLEELNTHASKIEKAKFEPLISAIFEIADEIDRDADRERGFSFGDNYLRIHWLIPQRRLNPRTPTARCARPADTRHSWQTARCSRTCPPPPGRAARAAARCRYCRRRRPSGSVRGK